MRRGKVTRRKALFGLLIMGALVEAVLAVVVYASGGGGAAAPAEALPLHPVAGNFKADDTKLEDCTTRTCFEQAFGNIAYTRGPKAALSAFDDKYGNFSDPSCHRVVHAIGSASLARNKGNVARTFAQGSSSCFSGYYHGVLERSLLGVRGYNPDTLGRVARDLCDDRAVRASLWFTYQCLHGLGHGLMITSGYALPLPLKVCDRLSTGWDRTSCNGGVFMENISTLYGFKSSWLRDDDPVYPCNVVAEEDKIKCYEIVTSRILRVVDGDWAETSEICAEVEANWVEACFRSLGRDTAGQAHQDPTEIRRMCALARPSGGEMTCLDGAARAMTGNSKSGKSAAVLCNSIALEYQARCFYGIGSVMSLYGSTPGKREAACRSVTPSASYVAQCIRGGKDYLRLTGGG
jgi:hypothetical protein